MPNSKKLLQAASGAAAGGAVLDVDDVFSTYLYEGNGASQTIQNGINLGSSFGGQSYSFDGSDDLLLRTSDFTSNTDSKTFTFSCWYFSNLDQTGYWYTTSNGASNNGRVIIGRSNGNLSIICYNNSGSSILNVSTSANIPYGTWNHIVVSIDLANTSNRYVYINDSSHTVTYNTYTNDTIGFSNTTHAVSGNSYSSTSSGQTSLAHVFLDYTYRDLSVESNRRLFYSSSGEPATGQASLNPIMYMTLTSESSPNTNSGTGGDFTTQGSPTYNSNFGPDAGGSGEGGFVWIKQRTQSNYHYLFDTEATPITSALLLPLTIGLSATTTALTGFNSDGFSLGSNAGVNGTHDMVSWSWRKAPKFFDVVTYTGNGTAGRQIAHDLGCEVGCIIVKRTDGSGVWAVYHRGVDGGTAPETYSLFLHLTNGQTDRIYWNDTAPTSTEFTLGADGSVNGNGQTFVAYLFAHNDGDGEFGPDGDADIIKCGSYTGNGDSSGTNTIELGFEPQWLLIKRYDGSGDWFLMDVMRGMNDNVGAHLDANTANVESSSGTTAIMARPTGFSLHTGSNFNGSNDDFIYVAIRRGPLAAPEDATDVFAIDTGTNPAIPTFTSGFPVDMGIFTATTGDSNYIKSRLSGDKYLLTNSTATEATDTAFFDNMDGWENNLPSTYLSWMWKRAPSYFDVVAYTGTGSNRTVNHNLGVAPEMMWIKNRDVSENWIVYHKDVGATKYLMLDRTNAETTNSTRFNDTAPTASVFTVGTDQSVNSPSGHGHIAYLFATVDGVSKMGSYTGNGGTQTIDCGFSSGARFVLMKRTSGIGSWVVFDTARGITTSTDPLLYLDSNGAERSDLSTYDINPHSSGFTLMGGGTYTNSSGSSYIFYAIA